MTRQSNKSRTTEPTQPDHDVSEPWPVSIEQILNVKRKWQKLFQKRMKMKFMAGVAAMENLDAATPTLDRDGEEVDEYDILVNLLHVTYADGGAKFDFTNDDIFGYGWIDLMKLAGLTDEPPADDAAPKEEVPSSD